METSSVTDKLPVAVNESKIETPKVHHSASEIAIGLLTGCQDRPYAFGLAMALVAKGVHLDVIGSDEIDSPELHATPNLRFLNFGGSQRGSMSFAQKLSRLLVYYAKLICYTARSQPKMLHILWNNKFEYFDRTLLMAYFKMLGKTITLTAHNVNQARRDSKDSFLNRLTLMIQYRLCDHIFVHTEQMKHELLREFRVRGDVVTVIPFGINNSVPCTDLTITEAKRRLGLKDGDRTILFFGRIRPYKGIEYLLAAFRLLLTDNQANYRLVVAGEPKKGSEDYLNEIQQIVKRDFDQQTVILRIQFIPDEEMELYLKGADVLVLPYKEIFQSGVLFLAYSFGLPVVATDVGSFREDVIEGRTGFLCKPGDPVELAKAIEKYFASDLFKNLNVHRRELKDHANANHSWDAVADLTHNAYAKMLGRKSS
jgi:D-inositol-3-phosphate glycosyltransferase